MFGGIGNLTNILRSAKEIQAGMARLQEELGTRRYEGIAGGGMVRAVVDGRCSLVDVKIDPEATKDVELLEDLVKSAVGLAVIKAQDALKEEMAQMSGGLNIPGLSGLLGGSQP
ncbi:MAG: YbaB/EbfC family nucleoid-associated protein [Phycisphaerae bacterium]|nr:YbaB/EbfC family nucleoid-associated protein [Phycisphaerae bacterium]